MDLRRIVCPVDFGVASLAGLTPAVSLGTEYGGEIVLVHVLDFPFPQIDSLPVVVDVDEYYSQVECSATERLESLIDEETRRFVDVTTEIARGRPYLEITRIAEERDADLIVIPTHARKSVGRLLFGSTTEKVVRLAPCPVLTVHPGDEHSAFQPQRIVMATDFSEAADAALEHACDLATKYGAKLWLLHLIALWGSEVAHPVWRFPSIPSTQTEALGAAAKAQLEARARSCGNELDVQTKLARTFDTATDILRIATDDLDADLIVMGTHGHTGIERVALGSVAENVVRYSDVPVLTVR